MDLPKYHETFIPILQILSDGKVIHYKELYKRVKEKYYSSLPADLLNKKTTSGDSLLFNRIGWGKSYLKIGKLLDYPERGMVQITHKGETVLKGGKFTLDDLHNDPDYLKYKELKKTQKIVKKEDVNIESSSPQDLIDLGFSAIEEKVKNDLLDKFKNIDPFYFEKVILMLLNKMGYGDFIETSKTADGGIDGIINEDKLGLEKIYIQAKRYSENKVREKDIRNFIGAMSGDTSKGVFVTTSSFDDAAIKKAHDAHHKIILIDGERLVDLMHQYGIGVQVRNVYEIKEVDEDFFDEI